MFLLLIGIDEDYTKKQYQKKYLMTTYFILTILIIYMNMIKIRQVYLLNIVLYLFISSVGAINLAYSDSFLEKRLSSMRLFIFKFSEWIYLIRSYIILMYMMLLNLLLNFLSLSKFNDLDETSHFFIVLIFMMIVLTKHLIYNARDIFGFISLDKTKEKFEEHIGEFNKKYDICREKDEEEIAEDIKILDYMTFLVYMEDKDILSRDKFKFKIKPVISRKKNCENKSSKKNYNKMTLREQMKCMKRGYSTIPQQLIRRISMTEYSYTKKTIIRRKLFIERSYMSNFFCAYFENKKIISNSILSNKVKYTLDMLKVDIIKAYFDEVLKCPKNKEDLFKIMSKNSRLNENQYVSCYDKFISSDERTKNMKIIVENFYRCDDNNNIIINEKNKELVKGMI